jgi:hypothetical protein
MLPKPRPIRRTAFGITSRTNVPYDQPLTPGLRKQTPANAIGFTADLTRELVLVDEPAARKRD